MTETLIILGIVNWLATMIVVESEICRPLREWVTRRYERYDYFESIVPASDWRQKDHRRLVFWQKVKYLVGCHLCAGTWVGLVLAALVPEVRPVGTGFVGWVIAGLAIKAIGHITLEVTAVLRRTNA